MMRGIDISNWQAGLNLQNIKIDFVICKATEGLHFVDAYCDGWIQQAKECGLPWGFYHFADSSDPVEQADYFIKNCANYFGEGIPVLDIEDSLIYDWGDFSDKFTKRVHEKTGVWPLVYASAGFLPYFEGYDVTNNCGLWCAGYPYPASSWTDEICPYDPYPFTTLAIWQFTSSLVLSGYGSTLDGDIAYMDEKAWYAYAKATEKIPATSKIKPNSNIAFRVIKGEFGNGLDRKRKLEKAGYDYKEVQRYINELYSKANRVLHGEYGNGNDRKKLLGDEYSVVQYIVNDILS